MDTVIKFFIAILILRLIIYILTPSKGKRGEKAVSKIFNKLNKNEYIIIDDLLLHTTNGSSQIDHIVVSIYGIFVIETKNFSGWIHGSEKSENWTQTIYKEKNKFRNPIKQNWSHIFALKNLLKDYSNIDYFPIVVFVGSAVLKNVHTTLPVVYGNNLLLEISKKSIDPKLTMGEVIEISSILIDSKIKDKTELIKHTSTIKMNIKQNISREKEIICPKCNGSLILRNGKYGQFYGCSNYPSCRYTKKT